MILLPTYQEGNAHQTWDLEITSKMPRMYKAIQDFDVVAMPSSRVSYEMGEYFDVDTSGQFDIHYEWGGATPRYVGQGNNFVFKVEPFGNRSKMQVTPQVMYVSAGYDEFEEKRFENSLFNLVGRRMIGMNKGFTWAFNYELFASQNSAKELDAVDGDELDIDKVVLAGLATGAPWAQPGIKLGGYPASPLNRIHSLPFLIRPHILGHTIHGRSSVNISHRSHVYVAQGVGATQAPQIPSGAPYIDTAITDDYLKDIIIADKTTPVFPTLADIDFVVGNMQIGNRFTVLGCTSSQGLAYLRRNLFNYTLASVSEPLMDFGINYLNYVKHSGFNVVFYQDPMMDRLWPNSILFWDPTMVPFGCVQGWAPRMREWVYLQQTLGTWVTAKILWCQRFILNPQSAGWLLNCRWN